MPKAKKPYTLMGADEDGRPTVRQYNGHTYGDDGIIYTMDGQPRGPWYCPVGATRYQRATGVTPYGTLVKRQALNDIHRIEALRWRLLLREQTALAEWRRVLYAIFENGGIAASRTRADGSHVRYRVSDRDGLCVSSSIAKPYAGTNPVDCVSEIPTDDQEALGAAYERADGVLTRIVRHINKVDDALLAAAGIALRARALMPARRYDAAGPTVRFTANGRTYLCSQGKAAWPHPTDVVADLDTLRKPSRIEGIRKVSDPALF